MRDSQSQRRLRSLYVKFRARRSCTLRHCSSMPVWQRRSLARSTPTVVAGWFRRKMSAEPQFHLELERLNPHHLVFVHSTYPRYLSVMGDRATSGHIFAVVDMCGHCGNRDWDSEKPKLCNGCKVTKYCNRECQRAAWPRHRQVHCSLIRELQVCQ